MGHAPEPVDGAGSRDWARAATTWPAVPSVTAATTGLIGTAADGERARVAGARHDRYARRQAGCARRGVVDMAGDGGGRTDWRKLGRRKPGQVDQIVHPGTAAEIHQQRGGGLVRLGRDRTGQAPQDIILDLEDPRRPPQGLGSWRASHCSLGSTAIGEIGEDAVLASRPA